MISASEELKYPVGKFNPPATITAEAIQGWIGDIAALPAHLRHAVEGLRAEQLATPYREGGWTVRQVVHHIPDSHMNAYCRFKLTLTEERPTIKPYVESLWAELTDAREAPVETSLRLVEAVHERWVMLLQSMTPPDFHRTYVHPEYGKEFSLAYVTGMYAWHGKHHVAHIQSLRARRGW